MAFCRSQITIPNVHVSDKKQAECAPHSRRRRSLNWDMTFSGSDGSSFRPTLLANPRHVSSISEPLTRMSAYSTKYATNDRYAACALKLRLACPLCTNPLHSAIFFSSCLLGNEISTTLLLRTPRFSNLERKYDSTGNRTCSPAPCLPNRPVRPSRCT